MDGRSGGRGHPPSHAKARALPEPVIRPNRALPSAGICRSLGRVIRQDYLMRMIEQAAAMLARLLRLQVEDRGPNAALANAQAAREWLGLEPARLAAMTDEELVNALRGHGSVAEFPLRVGIAIRLLQIEADRLVNVGDEPGATAMRTQAICLLLRANILGVAEELPDFTPDLNELLKLFDDRGLPVRVAVLLMCQHEHTGQFAAAEDVLFELRESLGWSEWMAELGRTFYERVRRHPAETLTAGNLPPDEITAALGEWQEWEAGQRATQR